MADVVVADTEKLRSTIESVVRRVMLDEVTEAMRLADLPEWLSREEAKERYGLTDRQLTYLRQERRVEYSKHGRQIFYRRESMDEYFEEGKVEALKEA
jgi:hypothetical protein